MTTLKGTYNTDTREENQNKREENALHLTH